MKQMQKEAMAMKLEYKDLIQEHEEDQKKQLKSKNITEKQTEKRKFWSHFVWHRATTIGSNHTPHSDLPIPSPTGSITLPKAKPASRESQNHPTRPSSKNKAREYNPTPSTTSGGQSSVNTPSARASPHIIKHPAMLALMKHHDIRSNKTSHS